MNANKRELRTASAAALVMALLMAGCFCSGCTMGHGAFAALNPFTWLKPSTYIEMHRQHEANEEFERTNVVTTSVGAPNE
jgi:hypothetical protein